MYVSPWMQACLLPRKWDVCGIIATPVTLWHSYILRTTGNPYMCGGPRDLNAASEALMYAAGGIAHGRELYGNPAYRSKWRARVVRRMKRSTQPQIDAAVREWVVESLRYPGHRELDGERKGTAVAAPVEWVLAEYVCGGDPARLDAAFDTPYVLANCLFDARRNITGEDTSLISETDEERIDGKLARMAVA
jgi:hypothetical protein